MYIADKRQAMGQLVRIFIFQGSGAYDQLLCVRQNQPLETVNV